MGQAGIEPAFAVLQTAALPIELPTRYATNGNRTRDLAVDNRMLCPTELWRQKQLPVVGCQLPVTEPCRGKDSNLHPRPSECRALVQLSYRNSSSLRTAYCLLIQCTEQDSNLHATG